MSTISSCKLLLLIVCGLIATGCAHKKLLKAGESFNSQGRYELAIENYKNALSIEADDQETQKKLKLAQQQLDLWLDKILKQGDIAKQKGLDGRALLLYSKVAKIRHDQYALTQYKKLHQQLSSQTRYKLAIKKSHGLGNNLAHSLTNVHLISKIEQSKGNHFSLQLTLSPPSFVTRSVMRDEKQQYVSGSKTIANPEYLQLQQQIVDTRKQLQQYADDADSQQEQLSHARRLVSALAKDLEIAQLKLANTAPNSSVQIRWQQEVTRVNTALKQAQQEVSRQRDGLDSVNHYFNLSEQKLSKQLDALSYLAPTAEQDVLDDYRYQIKQVTRTGSGQLTSTFSDGVTALKTVTASYTDDGHGKHPLIELKHNPVSLISDKKLRAQYYQNSTKQAEQDINNHFIDYRNNLKYKAEQTPGIDQKLEAWVLYGLCAKQGVDGQTADRMRNQLAHELGIAGEFDINQLLYMFEH
jgi:hypothetical protein